MPSGPEPGLESRGGVLREPGFRPDDEKRCQLTLRCQCKARVQSHDHEGRCPGISFQCGIGDDTDRRQVVRDGVTSARIEDVRKALSIVLEEVAIVARSCDGRVC